MPKALANRLMHFDVEGNFDAWKAWAIEHGIHPFVTGFLSFKQNYLMGFDPSSDDLAFPTPRAWEMVSNVLNFGSGDMNSAYPFIAGLIGTGVAIEMRTWIRVYSELPNIEDIFNGVCRTVPKNTDALYALTSSMTAYAREHKDDMKKIVNSIRYADLLPADYSAMLLKDYTYIEKGYKEKLMKIPEFMRWLTSKGKLLNGNI
jgi:hypothetical protein